MAAPGVRLSDRVGDPVVERFPPAVRAQAGTPPHKTLALTKRGDPQWKAALAYGRPRGGPALLSDGDVRRPTAIQVSLHQRRPLEVPPGEPGIPLGQRGSVSIVELSGPGLPSERQRGNRRVRSVRRGRRYFRMGGKARWIHRHQSILEAAQGWTASVADPAARPKAKMRKMLQADDEAESDGQGAPG